MGMTTKKLERIYTIYDQLYDNPFESLYKIAQNTAMSRNTVRKYLEEMYDKRVLTGPFLEVKPAPNCRRIVYLLDFEHPLKVFEELKGVDHVVYHTVDFGDWNCLVVTDKLMDFSQVGSYKVVYRGDIFEKYVPKVELYGWNTAFFKINMCIHGFEPEIVQKTRVLAPVNVWGEQEWKLFYAFQKNPRKKVIKTLRDIDVTYEQYKKWKKTLEIYCNIHTGFYPLGVQMYMVYKFLVSSDFEEVVRKIFGLFPVTPVITEVGNELMVTVYVVNPENCRKLFCMITDLKAKNIVKKVKKSMNIFSYRHYKFFDKNSTKPE